MKWHLIEIDPSSGESIWLYKSFDHQCDVEKYLSEQAGKESSFILIEGNRRKIIPVEQVTKYRVDKYKEWTP